MDGVFVHDQFHSLGLGSLLMKALVACAEMLKPPGGIELVVRATDRVVISAYLQVFFEQKGHPKTRVSVHYADINVIAIEILIYYCLLK
jgi:GNAT superfamily N-acetyltransferase